MKIGSSAPGCLFGFFHMPLGLRVVPAPNRQVSLFRVPAHSSHHYLERGEAGLGDLALEFGGSLVWGALLAATGLGSRHLFLPILERAARPLESPHSTTTQGRH